MLFFRDTLAGFIKNMWTHIFHAICLNVNWKVSIKILKHAIYLLQYKTDSFTYQFSNCLTVSERKILQMSMLLTGVFKPVPNYLVVKKLKASLKEILFDSYYNYINDEQCCQLTPDFGPYLLDNQWGFFFYCNFIEHTRIQLTFTKDNL